MLLKVESLRDAGMIETLQDLEFLKRASADRFARGCIAACHRIQADAALPLRVANVCVVESLRDPFRRRPVVSATVK